MIPEQYWLILRRWFWLIGMFAVAGGALAVVGLPYVLGYTSSYDSSATISVAHYVSPTRIVETGAENDADTVVADYTQALAIYAETPQFVAAVREQLAAQGLSAHSSAIENQLRIEAVPALFRIDVHASGGSRAVTDAMVTAATNVLIKRAEDEEARVAFGLVANLDTQRTEIVARLDALEEQRLVLLRREIEAAGPALADRPEVTRLVENTPLLTGGQALVTEMRDLISGIAQILGDPGLIAIDVEMQTAQQGLETLTAQRERVLANRVYSAPLAVLNPTETVETQADTLPMRDLIILGGAAGLVAGWGVANLFDRLRKDRPETSPAPLRVVSPESNGDLRLRALIDRSAEVERRARALATSLGGNGREAQRIAVGERE